MLKAVRAKYISFSFHQSLRNFLTNLHRLNIYYYIDTVIYSSGYLLNNNNGKKVFQKSIRFEILIYLKRVVSLT